MIQASIYGRLVRDPQTRQSRNDVDMVTASVGIDGTPGNSEESETNWMQELAFVKLSTNGNTSLDTSAPKPRLVYR